MEKLGKNNMVVLARFCFSLPRSEWDPHTGFLEAENKELPVAFLAPCIWVLAFRLVPPTATLVYESGEFRKRGVV